MMFLKIVTFGLVLSCFSVSAQSNKEKSTKEFDPNYVASFKKRVHLYVFLASKGSDVTLYNVANKNESVQYSPNNFLNIGFGVNTKFISLETSFRVPFVNTTDPKKGQSSVVNIRGGFIRKKIWISGIIQNVSGFYMAKPENIYPNWFKNNADYPLRSDIRQNLFYLTGNYIFNHSKFSYSSTLNAYEHQIKSAGSFVTGLTFANYGASGNKSLLPEILNGKYSSESDILKSRITHFGLNGGYLHTFAIKKKYFIHIGSVASVGFKKTNTTFADFETASQKGIGVIFDNKMSIGYNGTKNLCSVNFNALILSDNFRRRIQFDYQFLRLIYSRRI